MEYQDENRVLGWDDEIEKDDEEFIVLTPGEYEFTVTGFERKYWEGSEKVPACPMAEIKARVYDPVQGSTTVTERLFLISKFEWKLSQFFASIGQKKKGEKLRPRWNEVLGAEGRCKVVVNAYKDKNGADRQNNRVDRWLEPGEEQKAAAWTPGNF